jgi:ABC-type multidrug transport system ATPase subunit
MLHQPDLLVLDEPTTGVDPVSRADLWWLIARAAANGAAVVFATSYLDEAERALDVLALDDGRELASGTPEEIIAAMPGTLRVSDARPEGDARRRAWRRGGRWRIWDPAEGPGPLITDLRHQNQGEPDAIMTKVREEPDEAREPGRPVAPDLQDAVTVAILARELAAAGTASGEPEGGGSR